MDLVSHLVDGVPGVERLMALSIRSPASERVEPMRHALSRTREDDGGPHSRQNETICCKKTRERESCNTEQI